MFVLWVLMFLVFLVSAALGERQQPHLRVAALGHAELAGFSGVPATSIPVPSQATSRSPNANAPAVPWSASGPRCRSDNNSSYRAPG